MYAAIRQGKAKTGMAEELARRIKEGAIPIISDVPGFRAYYVIYAPDDTVTAISIFDDYAGAQESNKRGLAWIRTEPGAPAHRAGHCGRRAGDRAYVGVVYRATSPARHRVGVAPPSAQQRHVVSPNVVPPAPDPAYPPAGRTRPA